ncbi:STAS domain-containing protein [Bacillus taeanensis]
MIKYFPQPCFKINRNFDILDQSDEAKYAFKPALNFLDLVDSESIMKAKKILLQDYLLQDIELFLNTNASPLSLFDCSIKWHDDAGYLICVEQDSRLNELSILVQQHQQRLAKTDFELLEKKEQLETSLKQIKQLSAPFIKLLNGIGFVPFFGNLDEELIKQNEQSIQKACYEETYEKVLFDFSGIDKLTEQGVEKFVTLIKGLHVMGVDSYVIGVKPNHAFYLKNYNTEIEIIYLRHLHNVIRFYINEKN